MYEYVGLIVLFPLIGLLINGLLGRKIKSEVLVGTIGSAAVGLSFIVAAAIFVDMLGAAADDRSHVVTLFTWLAAGSFKVSAAYQVDQLSILMTLVVTGVGFLIHVYSIGYMHGDRGFWRFFTYLNLFIFAMLNLVLADNYVLMFLGWEGVGLCSYLLIGFWYDKKFPGVSITWTGDAANKAFYVNRIGDFAFMIGMFLIFKEFGTLTYYEVMDQAEAVAVGDGTMFWITLLLFIGATGKSAQIPLFIWLPDAMAGPTPVSALIHAATMVTAGVYMVARNAALYALAPDTMMIVAIVGAVTAIMAASIGIAQNDIKKVLAYSTVSQLGFMFLALGVGAFTAAIFHLMTHAFFKACLFLGSGSVIHALHEEQDIRRMGGLKRIMPRTYWTFLISSFAIAGFPPLSGFFSKDEILWKAFADASPILWGIGAIAAFMTAFYMFRMVTLTFLGEARWESGKHPHESPASMTIPLIVLAFLAIFGGFVGVPAVLGGGNAIHQWLHPVYFQAEQIMRLPEHHNHALEYLLMGISVAIALGGFLLGRNMYLKDPEADRKLMKLGVLYRVLANKYYIDEAYDGAVVKPLVKSSETLLYRVFDVGIIDGIVNGLGRLATATSSMLRTVQTGIIQNYAAVLVLGIVLVLGLIILI